MIGSASPRSSRPRPATIARRVLASVAGLLLGIVGLVGLTAAPAAAAQPNCPSTYLCFYADPNYSGGTGKVTGDNTNFSRFSTSASHCGNHTWDNCVSSVFNAGSSCTVYLYSGYSYTGVRHSLARGDGYTNLANIGFDDTLSSNKWCSPA